MMVHIKITANFQGVDIVIFEDDIELIVEVTAAAAPA